MHIWEKHTKKCEHFWSNLRGLTDIWFFGVKNVKKLRLLSNSFHAFFWMCLWQYRIFLYATMYQFNWEKYRFLHKCSNFSRKTVGNQKTRNTKNVLKWQNGCFSDKKDWNGKNYWTSLNTAENKVQLDWFKDILTEKRILLYFVLSFLNKKDKMAIFQPKWPIPWENKRILLKTYQIIFVCKNISNLCFRYPVRV